MKNVFSAVSLVICGGANLAFAADVVVGNGAPQAAFAAASASVASADEAAWIGDGEPMRVGAAFYEDDPAPEFRTTFVLPEGRNAANVTIACAGYYQMTINGRPAGVSETSLMPLWSPFDKTVYSDTVTARVGDLLKPSPAANEISVTLGNGFYNLPPIRFWNKICFREHLAHGRPCFRLKVGGVTAPLVWKWRKTNILRNCLYLGAVVDASKDGDANERPAAAVSGPKGRIVPRLAPPIAYRQTVEGNVIRTRPDGTYVIDFGANLSGVPTFVFSKQAKGDRIEIVYGERLNAEGGVNPLTQTAGQVKKAGSGGPGAPALAAQRDVYVASGADEERFEPPFVWHICRYAEVHGAKAPPRVRLRTVVSDLRTVAPGVNFASRNAKIRRLHEVCVRTFRDNLIGVQSDCPGRERLGYGGDIVATCEAMCLNFDMREFYLKTLQDFADEAADDGWITETAPFVGISDQSSVTNSRRAGPISWALAVPVLIETLSRHYPDVAKRALAYYPVCARHARQFDALHPSGLVPTCIGDHEAIEYAPRGLTATAHWHEFARLTANFARRRGKTDDAAEFEAVAAKVKAAFQAKYVHGGLVGNGTQSAQATALFLGLVPEDQTGAARERLIGAVRERGYAPSTGIFSTRYMLMYLSTHGSFDVARRIVLHRGYPGWLNMLDCGATTLWETWTESDNVYSNCHPMFGSVDEWILKYGRGVR